MANTYSQIYIQIIFTVKNREELLQENFREELEHYFAGIIEKRGAKLHAIYCMPDHVHIFLNLKPSHTLSDLVKDIKTGSGFFINDRNFLGRRFLWEEGFDAFSYSQSHIDRVVSYIGNQKEHHTKTNFKEEYASFLQKLDIQFQERYLFEWV